MTNLSIFIINSNTTPRTTPRTAKSGGSEAAVFYDFESLSLQMTREFENSMMNNGFTEGPTSLYDMYVEKEALQLVVEEEAVKQKEKVAPVSLPTVVPFFSEEESSDGNHRIVENSFKRSSDKTYKVSTDCGEVLDSCGDINSLGRPISRSKKRGKNITTFGDKSVNKEEDSQTLRTENEDENAVIKLPDRDSVSEDKGAMPSIVIGDDEEESLSIRSFDDAIDCFQKPKQLPYEEEEDERNIVSEELDLQVNGESEVGLIKKPTCRFLSGNDHCKTVSQIDLTEHEKSYSTNLNDAPKKERDVMMLLSCADSITNTGNIDIRKSQRYSEQQTGELVTHNTTTGLVSVLTPPMISTEFIYRCLPWMVFPRRERTSKKQFVLPTITLPPFDDDDSYLYIAQEDQVTTNEGGRFVY